MTVCQSTTTTEATNCLWGLAGDATTLAVAATGFTFIALLWVLAVVLLLKRRRRRRRRRRIQRP